MNDFITDDPRQAFNLTESSWYQPTAAHRWSLNNQEDLTISSLSWQTLRRRTERKSAWELWTLKASLVIRLLLLGAWVRENFSRGSMICPNITASMLALSTSHDFFHCTYFLLGNQNLGVNSPHWYFVASFRNKIYHFGHGSLVQHRNDSFSLAKITCRFTKLGIGDEDDDNEWITQHTENSNN